MTTGRPSELGRRDGGEDELLLLCRRPATGTWYGGRGARARGGDCVGTAISDNKKKKKFKWGNGFGNTVSADSGVTMTSRAAYRLRLLSSRL